MTIQKFKKNIFFNLISALGYTNFFMIYVFNFVLWPEVHRLNTIEHDSGWPLGMTIISYTVFFYIIYTVLFAIFLVLGILEYKKNDKLTEKFKIYSNITSFLEKIPFGFTLVGIITLLLPYLFYIYFVLSELYYSSILLR